MKTYVPIIAASRIVPATLYKVFSVQLSQCVRDAVNVPENLLQSDGVCW